MSDYDHKEFPKTRDPKDFWGQVKRTINGEPVSQAQIDLIVAAVCNGLILSKEDILLDIGCGNGALSAFFFDYVKKLIGVDFSEYLISVAKQNFEKPPNYIFNLGDAFEFISRQSNEIQITKMLCYGAFQYFGFEMTEKILVHLNREYKKLTRIYIGNLPDKDKADSFFYKDIDFKKLLNDPQTSIGIWRTKDEMTKLAHDCGWKITFHHMPQEFYASHYRYDVILTR
jgi:cyclopropane fatty-acyl-phospholipid synthase-like methyltransferase